MRALSYLHLTTTIEGDMIFLKDVPISSIFIPNNGVLGDLTHLCNYNLQDVVPFTLKMTTSISVSMCKILYDNELNNVELPECIFST